MDTVTPASPATPPRAAVRWSRLAGLAAVLLPVLLYLPSLQYGFVYDDVPLLQENPAIRDLGRVPEYFTRDIDALRLTRDTVQSNYYRPLFATASAVVWKFAGTEAWRWHAAVVLLHGMAGLLAYRVLRGESLTPLPALAGACLFAWHPVHVDSVAWVSGLQDVLLGATALLAFLAYRRVIGSGDREPAAGSAAALGGMAAAHVLALLAKEAAVGLLLFAMGEWLWRARRAAAESNPRLAGAGAHRRAVAILGAITLVYLGVRWAVLGTPFALPLPTSPPLPLALASVPMAIATYLGYLFWPVGLFLLSPLRPVASIGSAAGVIGLVVTVAALSLAAFWVRRRPAAWQPCLWFVAWLAPALSLWALNPEWLVSDRYLYLPVLALGWGLAHPAAGPRTPGLRWGLLAVSIVAFGGLSLAAMPAYRDERAFWDRAARADPRSAVVWTEQARLLAARGDTAAARAALQRATELDPASLLPWLRLGNLAFTARDMPAAARAYRQVIAMNPDYVLGWRNLASALAAGGQVDEALATARDAAARFPRDAPTLATLAVLLRSHGLRDEALATLERARAADPGDAMILLRLATLCAEAGRFEDALRHVEDGLALAPPAAVRAQLEQLRERIRAAGGGV